MIWARLYWFFLHAMGYAYKSQDRELTLEEKTNLKLFFSVWCKYLHCGICINHCEDYLKTKLDVIDTWVHSREVWLFTVEFHNEVNRTTKKPELSVDNAEQELVNRILLNYKVSDMKTFPWLMEEFTHVIVLFISSFMAQTKMNMPSAYTDMKLLMESLAYVMPFQFHKLNERTLREVWTDRIATWDWTRIQEKPDMIFDLVRDLFSSLMTAQSELMNHMLVYLNKEGAALAQERLSQQLNKKDEEAKALALTTTTSSSSTTAGLLDKWHMYIVLIVHVLVILLVLACVRIGTKEFVSKEEPRPQVARVNRVM